MDEDLAQIAVASLADAEESGLTTSRVCRGASPSHAANSRPFRKAEPLPIAATARQMVHCHCLLSFEVGASAAAGYAAALAASISEPKTLPCFEKRSWRLTAMGVWGELLREAWQISDIAS
jgi:hypothetical protein